MAAAIVDSQISPRLPSTKHEPIIDSFRSASAAVIIDDKRDDQLDHSLTPASQSCLTVSSIRMEKPTNSIPGVSPDQARLLDKPNAVDKSATSIGQHLSETSRKKIAALLEDVGKLNDIEKLFLYVQLPDGTSSNSDTVNIDKKKVLYPLGKKTDTEVLQAYTWIQSHLEEDSTVSIPKHEVYDEYQTYCEATKSQKLCVADFGKAMKHIFPYVKPRRLGQRGNSKYCYSGLRKKILVESPELPALDTSEYEERDRKHLQQKDAMKIILKWVESTLDRKFDNYADFAHFLINQNDPQGNSQLMRGFNLKTPTAKKKDSSAYSATTKRVPNKTKCDINGAKATGSICSSHQSLSGSKGNDPGTTLSAVGTFPSPIAAQASVCKTEPEEAATCKVRATKVPSTGANSSLGTSSALMVIAGNGATQATTREILSNHLTGRFDKSPVAVNNFSTVINGSTIKYKPIQPKQQQPTRQFELENNNFNIHSTLNADKLRRHSVSTPFNGSICEIKREDDGLTGYCSEIKLADNDKNFKRQIDEKDFQFMSKKRHVSHEENGSATSANSALHSPLVSATKATSIENCDLKVNELETEALFDYLNTSNPSNAFENGHNGNNSNAAEDNSQEFATHAVQIRKLLEGSLPNFGQPNGSQGSNDNLGNCNGDSTSTNLFLEHSNSNSMSAMPSKCSNFQFTDNSPYNAGMASTEIPNNSLDGLPAVGASLVGNGNGQIPPSPNSRRRQFNFQPISPRNSIANTPIPENSALEMNSFKAAAFNSGFSNAQEKQMSTVAVGPSQPSSEANSPFISPRNTPISMSRSRNNSGQSSFGAFRQTTPLQATNFDSGVSSISSSPFVSPHSTPVPGGGLRLRPHETTNIARNLARVRHSSGPGGPSTRSQVSNVLSYHRSNSLSPMVSGEGSFFGFSTNPTFYGISSQSLSSAGSTATATFGEVPTSKLVDVLTQTDTKQSGEMFHFNGQLENLPYQGKAMHQRQRHFSNPYGEMSSNSALLKPDGTESLKMLLHRSQSVPLSEMLQSNLFDSSGLEGQFDSFTGLTAGTSNGGGGGGECTISALEETLSSKSYPTTPLCTNSFKLPHTSMGTSASRMNGSLGVGSFFGDVFEPSRNDAFDAFIQSDRDLLVSSVQLKGINEASATSSADELNVPSSPLMPAKHDEDEFSDLLLEDNVIEQYQSIEGFTNCDNDFSNIALENQTNSFDIDNFEYN